MTDKTKSFEILLNEFNNLPKKTQEKNHSFQFADSQTEKKFQVTFWLFFWIRIESTI